MKQAFVTEPQPGGYEEHAVAGDVRWHLASPPEFVLWCVRSTLGDGATVSWSGHGDEAVYVVSGSVEVDGKVCPEGGAVIAEAGADVELRAGGTTQLAHFGSRAVADARGRRVHVVGPGGTWASVGDGRDTRYFADSECDGCDVTLFYTGRDHEYVSAPHSHSADELLHVVQGEVHVGRRVLGPGSTVAVAADVRYGFRSPGFGFLNYRPGISTITRDGVTLEEGGRAHGFDAVMDLR